MANVNPPPLKIPRSVNNDPEMLSFFRELVTHLRQMWLRTGAGEDLFEGVTVTGTYPDTAAAVYAAVLSERINDMEKQLTQMRELHGRLAALSNRVDQIEVQQWASV